MLHLSWWAWWVCARQLVSHARSDLYEGLALFLLLSGWLTFVSWSPCSGVTYLPATRASLFRSSGQWQGWLGEVTAITGLINYVFDHQNLPLLRSPTDGHSYGTQISSHFSSIQRCQTIYIFPKYFCHQFFNSVPLKSLTFQPFHWPQPMNQWTITFLAISPAEQSG